MISRLAESDETFRAALDRAREVYVDELERECDRRAFEGYERPLYQGGRLVGTTRGFSDRLAEIRLKALRPSVYKDTQPETTGAASFNVSIGIHTRDGNPIPPAARRHPPPETEPEE